MGATGSLNDSNNLNLSQVIKLKKNRSHCSFKGFGKRLDKWVWMTILLYFSRYLTQ